MEKETIIELKNIRKEFPGVVALDNVNMKIRASEVHALVGENGAGKSTLMKILSGTYSNYGGSVICKGCIQIWNFYCSAGIELCFRIKYCRKSVSGT